MKNLFNLFKPKHPSNLKMFTINDIDVIGTPSTSVRVFLDSIVKRVKQKSTFPDAQRNFITCKGNRALHGGRACGKTTALEAAIYTEVTRVLSVPMEKQPILNIQLRRGYLYFAELIYWTPDDDIPTHIIFVDDLDCFGAHHYLLGRPYDHTTIIATHTDVNDEVLAFYKRWQPLRLTSQTIDNKHLPTGFIEHSVSSPKEHSPDPYNLVTGAASTCLPGSLNTVSAHPKSTLQIHTTL